MASDFAILFLHHAADALTSRRAEALARLNPGTPLIPLTYGAKGVLPGTFDGAAAPGYGGQDPWSSTDLALYGWFRHARTAATTADRYVVVEYDMVYTVPLAEYYRGSLDAGLVGAQLYFPGPHAHWPWFAQALPRLPPQLRPFAAGVTPLTGVAIAHDVLAAVSSGPIPEGVYCECRLATLAHAAGAEMAELPYSHKRALSWREEFIDLTRPAPAYHPVKRFCAWDAAPPEDTPVAT